MPISPATRLGRYEIRSLLGAGGMGEVYLARDPKINRDVAIKVIPAAFSADSERLRRFEQEAQAAGALNHPNILSIYDVDTHDGSPYVVSELLEGETLREQLNGAALPVRKARWPRKNPGLRPRQADRTQQWKGSSHCPADA